MYENTHIFLQYVYVYFRRSYNLLKNRLQISDKIKTNYQQARCCLYASMRVCIHHFHTHTKKAERALSVFQIILCSIYCSGSIFIYHVQAIKFKIFLNYQICFQNRPKFLSQKISEPKYPWKCNNHPDISLMTEREIRYTCLKKIA